jgi:hypothetical protein
MERLGKHKTADNVLHLTDQKPPVFIAKLVWQSNVSLAQMDLFTWGTASRIGN